MIINIKILVLLLYFAFSFLFRNLEDDRNETSSIISILFTLHNTMHYNWCFYARCISMACNNIVCILIYRYVSNRRGGHVHDSSRISAFATTATAQPARYANILCVGHTALAADL